MEDLIEARETEAAAPAEVTADQETLARSSRADELQEILDEKVADTLLNSDLEVETSEHHRSRRLRRDRVIPNRQSFI